MDEEIVLLFVGEEMMEMNDLSVGFSTSVSLGRFRSSVRMETSLSFSLRDVKKFKEEIGFDLAFNCDLPWRSSFLFFISPTRCKISNVLLLITSSEDSFFFGSLDVRRDDGLLD